MGCFIRFIPYKTKKLQFYKAVALNSRLKTKINEHWPGGGGATRPFEFPSN